MHNLKQNEQKLTIMRFVYMLIEIHAVVYHEKVLAQRNQWHVSTAIFSIVSVSRYEMRYIKRNKSPFHNS